jgi:hypothetical protein
MSRRTVHRVLALGGCLSLCLSPLGCIPVYYAYPTVSYVPAVHVDKEDGTIYAFRVDIADHQGCIDFAGEDGYLDHYVLSAIPLPGSGRIPAQSQVSLDYGWVWNCIALIYDGHTQHTVNVRLYQPGWQTIEVHPWEHVKALKWKEATGLAERERAIDGLVSTWETDFPYRSRAQASSSESPAPHGIEVFRGLAPGSASAEHRQVLLFAAGEYERLAAFGDTSDAGRLMQTRLNAKASKLRELAKE